MLAPQFSDGADAWQGEDSWMWDASYHDWAAQGGASRMSPWPSHPTRSDIDRVQAQIQELQMWKLHAEANLRSYEALSWQAGATVNEETSKLPSPLSALEIPSWQRVAEEVARTLEPSGPGKHSRTSSSPTTSAGASPLASTRTSLSSLPLPMRLPIGPEPIAPMATPSSAKVSLQASETQEPLLRGLSALHPLGVTLTRAAAIRAEEDDSKEPRLQLPPGLLDDDEDDLLKGYPEQAAAAQLPASVAMASASTAAGPSEVSPGITVGNSEVLGAVCTRAEWRIEDLRGKLQASMGRPLVSPPFAARGLPNLRLMIFPDAREAVKGVRSRERKSLYATMVKKGPLHGSLKLKADCLESATVLRFHLTVGAVRRGPFAYNFSECAIHGCEDFATDWLKQIDESGSLRVGVEILDVMDANSRGAEELLELCNGATRMYSQDPVEPGIVKSEAAPTSGGRGRGKRGGASRLRPKGG
eukprot:TRINITY_DN47278_c0_g1_i1.p1 TRINITY_DN47278_c0_g1~~TRINITY_DN47278_c0_g1_i1.p1  ORF type:complete len:497 (-),score=79.12 TRINITY_DN47278_c0_g1_i1:125-1543(-)